LSWAPSADAVAGETVKDAPCLKDTPCRRSGKPLASGGFSLPNGPTAVRQGWLQSNDVFVEQAQSQKECRTHGSLVPVRLSCKVDPRGLPPLSQRVPDILPSSGHQR